MMKTVQNHVRLLNMRHVTYAVPRIKSAVKIPPAAGDGTYSHK